MANESELDLANREFEQISPTQSNSFSSRLREAFQIVTVTPGLPNIGQRAYTSPGSAPYQTGPTMFSDVLAPGSSPGGEGTAPIINFIGGPTFAGPPHPGSDPVVGPEETLRYSCVDSVCLQDPNGLYYGLDECLAAGCILTGGGGGDGSGDGDGDGPDGGGAAQCYDRAVHCTFAAMILDQPRRPGVAAAAARQELVSGIDTEFDGTVVRAFLRILDTESEGYQMADDHRFVFPTPEVATPSKLTAQDPHASPGDDENPRGLTQHWN